jgi:hypothetical protein
MSRQFQKHNKDVPTFLSEATHQILDELEMEWRYSKDNRPRRRCNNPFDYGRDLLAGLSVVQVAEKYGVASSGVRTALKRMLLRVKLHKKERGYE